MADDPTNDDKPDTSAKPDAGTDKPDLGDAGKRALDAERAARKAAEKQTADLAARLKEIEDRDKSDGEKQSERLAAAEKRANDAEARAMRLEIAATKGLTASQAKRLVGTTKEELEADADELLADFAPANGGDESKPTPGGRPKERLRGGGDPTEEVEETDPRKLAEMVSRT